MKKISSFILRVEEVLAGGMLIMISGLVFFSALARTVGMPINWAQDIALLAFAWLTFIGADIVAKTGNLIRIDMLEKWLPKTIRKGLALIFDVAMILFLLVSQSWYRTFQTMKLSYAWCTLAVPVGSMLLIFTMIGKMIKDIKTPVAGWGDETC